MQAVFELLGGAVAQGRVQRSAIVVPLDDLADAGFQIDAVAVPSSVDFLLFERLHEAPHFCVVVRVADTAHAGLDTVFQQQADVRVGQRGR